MLALIILLFFTRFLVHIKLCFLCAAYASGIYMSLVVWKKKERRFFGDCFPKKTCRKYRGV